MHDSKEPFVKNAADEKQVRSAGEKEKNARERELNDIRVVLSNPAGRRFYWRYLARCGVYRTSFTTAGGNSTTFYNEGMRNVGLQLLADLEEARPEAYLQMLQENKKNV